MNKKWVTLTAVLKRFYRDLNKTGGPIRVGLLWDFMRSDIIWEAQEITFNPWMIVVKNNEEIQTVLEQRMPLRKREGEILRDLFLETLPGTILDEPNNPTTERGPAFWSFRIHKTQA